MNGLQVIQAIGIGAILIACALGFSLDSFKHQRGLAPSEAEKKALANWMKFRRAICFFASFLFFYAAINGLGKGETSAFIWVAFAVGSALFWVGAYGLPDRSFSSILIAMMPAPPMLPALPPRALTWSRSIGLFFLFGFFVALFGNDSLSGTSTAGAVAAAFPVLRAVSDSSIDPGSWMTYFTIMIGLHLCFLPVAVYCLAYEVRDRPPRFIPWQIGLGVFVLLMLWFLLVGATTLFGESNSLHPATQHGRGVIFARLMTGSRLGLAFAGSVFMAGTFTLFSAAVVAAPIAVFKALTSRQFD